MRYAPRPRSAHWTTRLAPPYSLHGWIYKENPKGLFYSWNPEVQCPKPRPTPR
ncbi:hypothetical protein WBG99_13805 [Streptomyces sp. TG1A-60]|uniref:hypothetical protein n=1 Tax=Streptomyces sp. TG1A-60 TaxID=3129111 RepID=UPI0030CAB983